MSESDGWKKREISILPHFPSQNCMCQSRRALATLLMIEIQLSVCQCWKVGRRKSILDFPRTGWTMHSHDLALAISNEWMGLVSRVFIIHSFTNNDMNRTSRLAFSTTLACFLLVVIVNFFFFVSFFSFLSEIMNNDGRIERNFFFDDINQTTHRWEIDSAMGKTCSISALVRVARLLVFLYQWQRWSTMSWERMNTAEDHNRMNSG